MTVMDTVLCNEPEVKRLALAALEECTDLQAFGRRCLEILLNSLVSAKADEACGLATSFWTISGGPSLLF